MNLLEILTQMFQPQQSPAAAPAPLPPIAPTLVDPEQERLKKLGVSGEFDEMRRLGPQWAKQEHAMDMQNLNRLQPPTTGALPAAPAQSVGYGALPRKVSY